MIDAKVRSKLEEIGDRDQYAGEAEIRYQQQKVIYDTNIF
jgi:hypothetical protein